MDNHILRKYIDLYKANFSRISEEELYKWKAIETFQDNWLNKKHVDFNTKLSTSLAETKNLMASGNYFPRKVLLELSEIAPAEVKALFRKLYDEDTYYKGRIINFRKSFKELHRRIGLGKANDYQDHRAVMVYLSMRYPNKYYLYKYTMFKKFSAVLGLG